MKIAIVGAGASGLMATRALLERDAGVEVDLYEARVEPWGLIGRGTAPDHPDRDKWMTALGPTLSDPRVHLHLRRRLGADLTRDGLLADHDAVVYATGAPRQRPLRVPGEDLPGSATSAEFFGWYTGRPGARPFDLSGVREVVVVGTGDVSVDVARTLLRDPSGYRGTAMPDAVRAELAAHRVAGVTVLERRGPQDVHLKTAVLTELLDLPGVVVHANRSDLPVDTGGLADATLANLEVLSAAIDRHGSAETGPDRHGNAEPRPGRPGSAGPRPDHNGSAEPRRGASLTLRFWTRPVALTGRGGVAAVEVEGTRQTPGGGIEGDGTRDVIPAQLVIAATGFLCEPIPGLPFDARRNVIPSVEDRLVDEGGRVQPREYVTGWAKRGGRAGFGTARRDAEATVGRLLADLGSTASA